MGRRRQPFGADLGGSCLGVVARAFARRRFLVGTQSAAIVLAIGWFVEKPHVHLPLAEFADLAVFHGRRGSRLGRHLTQ